jgi:hypothetical protein
VETFDVNGGVKRDYVYKSPSGIDEHCKVLPPFPDSQDNYSKRDGEKEAELCSVNFYDPNVVLGAKVWSTSPGTIVYLGKDAKPGQKDQPDGVKKIASYKQTMNQPKTSGTFSQASLMYYHMARFFDTAVYVPPAVYREMDPKEHFNRVASKTSGGASSMNKAGWDALKNTASYTPKSEMWTSDAKKIYGIMVRGKGDRYGEIVNGMRRSWGVGQNEDFLKTPGTYAAMTGGTSLPDILGKGMVACADCKEPKMAKSISNWAKIAKADSDNADLAVKVQEIYWAKEMTEIAILDYIFSQQDRIGNIDYRWAWSWVETDPTSGRDEVKGEWVKEPLDTKKALLADIQKRGAKYKEGSLIRIMRTQLNDNDAGGRQSYANFTKKVKMLEQFRRLAPSTYEKVMQLDADLKRGSNSIVAQYFKKYFYLSGNQLAQLVNNSQAAAAILKANCSKIVFDLKPKEFILNGNVTPEANLCSKPALAFSPNGQGSFALAGEEPSGFAELPANGNASLLQLDVDQSKLKTQGAELSSFAVNLVLDFANYSRAATQKSFKGEATQPSKGELTETGMTTDEILKSVIDISADVLEATGEAAEGKEDEDPDGFDDVLMDTGLAVMSQVSGVAERVEGSNSYLVHAKNVVFGEDGESMNQPGCDLNLRFAGGTLDINFDNLDDPNCRDYLGTGFNVELARNSLKFIVK